MKQLAIILAVLFAPGAATAAEPSPERLADSAHQAANDTIEWSKPILDDKDKPIVIPIKDQKDGLTLTLGFVVIRSLMTPEEAAPKTPFGPAAQDPSADYDRNLARAALALSIEQNSKNSLSASERLLIEESLPLAKWGPLVDYRVTEIIDPARLARAAK